VISVTRLEFQYCYVIWPQGFMFVSGLASASHRCLPAQATGENCGTGSSAQEDKELLVDFSRLNFLKDPLRVTLDVPSRLWFRGCLLLSVTCSCILLNHFLLHARIFDRPKYNGAVHDFVKPFSGKC
jgi:hypothetical protein